MLRYERHFYMATGIHAQAVAAEFLEHAKDLVDLWPRWIRQSPPDGRVLSTLDRGARIPISLAGRG